jgi:erythromycin esterase-like protein
MKTATISHLADAIREAAHPIRGVEADYDVIVELARDAQVVLLGEATHGTHEFYAARAAITRRLIAQEGFNGVALEADWPDAYRVNRYVRGTGDADDPANALIDFERFPLWMWRNTEFLALARWLRGFNDGRKTEDRVGVYGLDLYSLHRSMEAVVHYLDKVDPEAARRARDRYACFDHFGKESQAYGYATGLGLEESCERQVIAQLQDLRRRAADYLTRDGFVAEDELFFAEQNARLAKNAEHYYRSMFAGRVSTWNLRDRHMAETLESLLAHLGHRSPHPRLVVWAHNSHLGDARATEMSRGGEFNVGQLTRERFGDEALLVGFTTCFGSVSAASDWGAPVERKRVRPALRGSYESIFHETGLSDFILPLNRDTQAVLGLLDDHLERAIGVVYLPKTERASHYYQASLPQQFDAVIHFDHTRALEPLDRNPTWDRGEGDLPETYPTGE